MIKNWWQVHFDIISVSHVMGNSILRRFAWKLLEIWDIELRDSKWNTELRDSKYLKINNTTLKFSKNFWNKNILKAAKFGVHIFNVLDILKIFRAAGKSDPPPGLIGTNTGHMSQSFWFLLFFLFKHRSKYILVVILG